MTEPLRTHDTKAAGHIPDFNWFCHRLRLKTSEFPCVAEMAKNPKRCKDCVGAQKLPRAGVPVDTLQADKTVQAPNSQQKVDKTVTKTNKTPVDKWCAYDKTRICDDNCCAFGKVIGTQAEGDLWKCRRGDFQLRNN